MLGGHGGQGKGRAWVQGMRSRRGSQSNFSHKPYSHCYKFSSSYSGEIDSHTVSICNWKILKAIWYSSQPSTHVPAN